MRCDVVIHGQDVCRAPASEHEHSQIVAMMVPSLDEIEACAALAAERCERALALSVAVVKSLKHAVLPAEPMALPAAFD
ncbi:MAG TPA: hypothetical protein VFI54_12460 [Solirubrobacteraceae bacterium]|nr:hypothetical protein [Solirubrobacteraceae bacterium]